MLNTTIITLESNILIEDDKELINYCKLQQHISRKLFNELTHHEVIFKEAQKRYIKEYKVHARLFKSIWIDVNSIIDGLKTRQKQRLDYLNNRLKDLSKTKNKNYNVFRKINNLKQRIAQPKDINNTWGSKVLFNKQWRHNDHNEWKKQWQRQRDHRLHIIGSKDETFGNSLCQLQTLTSLRLTLPNKQKLHLQVDFNKNKKQYQYLKTAISNGQALTWRILQRENGVWYAQVSFKITNECVNLNNGTIGVDINYALIATSNVKQDGNFNGVKNYDWTLSKNNKNKNTKLTCDIVNEIVKQAKLEHKTITIEKLDLKNKQKDAKLSMIAYNQFIILLKSKAVKEGVLVIDVNPAFTSIIGKLKYKERLGIGIHNSAAYAIGRRSMYRNEKLPRKMASLLQSEEKAKSNFQQWAMVSKKLKNVSEATWKSHHKVIYDLDQPIFNFNLSAFRLQKV